MWCEARRKDGIQSLTFIGVSGSVASVELRAGKFDSILMLLSTASEEIIPKAALFVRP